MNNYNSKRAEFLKEMLSSTHVIIEDDEWHMTCSDFLKDLRDDELVELIRKAIFIAGMRLAGLYTDNFGLVRGSLEISLEGTKTVIKLLQKSLEDYFND